jgi:hypothetical protein
MKSLIFSIAALAIFAGLDVLSPVARSYPSDKKSLKIIVWPGRAHVR